MPDKKKSKKNKAGLPNPIPQKEWRAEILRLVNKARREEGVPSLSSNSKLTKAAKMQSKYQAEINSVSHTGSENSDVRARIISTGYKARAYGENVAGGQQTPAHVFRSWMNSPGHKRNILDPDYVEMGLYVTVSSENRSYWTQTFAGPGAAAEPGGQ